MCKYEVQVGALLWVKFCLSKHSIPRFSKCCFILRFKADLKCEVIYELQRLWIFFLCILWQYKSCQVAVDENTFQLFHEGYSSILTFWSAVLLNTACSTDSSFRYCHGVGSFKGVNEVFIPLLLLEITVSRTLTQED